LRSDLQSKREERQPQALAQSAAARALRPRGSAFGCGNAAYRAVFISVQAMDGVNARKFSFGSNSPVVPHRHGRQLIP